MMMPTSFLHTPAITASAPEEKMKGRTTSRKNPKKLYANCPSFGVHKEECAQAIPRLYFTRFYGAVHLIIARALETTSLAHSILVVIRIFLALVIVRT
jgi:hypothetical protein